MRLDPLRLSVGGCGAALALVSLCAMAMGYAAWRGLLLGLVVVGAVLLERGRYKRQRPGAPDGFARTPERFVDPVTREPVTVWEDPATGERRYVRD